MKSYFAYIRVSTTKQGEHGSSLQEQRAAIEAYAARHALAITRWFEERETAAKQGRPEFTKLTKLLSKGDASGVVIHKIDRSARNLKDWAGLGELIDAGVEILFAHEGLDMQTRGGRLAADIQAVVAADFIRNLRDEVRKGFYGRLKQGLYPLPAPRGYADQGKGRCKTVDPIEGPLVREAFELYSTGQFSLDTLRLEMARRGLTSSSGKPLSLDRIAGLLHNPFYIGLIRLKRTGEVFEGIHLPLTDSQTFKRVQAIMAGRLYPRVATHTFRFRRLIVCGTCSRSLTGERQKGHVYYRCHERACRGVSIRETAVDALVADQLGYLQFGGRDLVDFRDLLAVHIARERIDAGDQADTLARDRALVAERLSRLTDALIDGSIDKAAFDERRATLLARKRELAEGAETESNLSFWEMVSERFELGLTAQQGYIEGTNAEKREMVELVSSNLVVQAKEPAFPMLFPFREIKEWAKSTDGAPYRGAVRTLDLIKRIAANNNEEARRAQRSPSSP